MLDKKKVEAFIDDIVEIYIVNENDLYAPINCSLRPKEPKLRGLTKATGRTFVKEHTIISFDDIIQVVIVNIIETMEFCKRTQDMQEEEFHRLFMYYGTEVEDEDRIKSAMLYNLILKRCKQYQYREAKLAEKKASKNINGVEVNIKNFSDFETTNSKGENKTIEDLIDGYSFDSNCLYLEGEASTKIQDWINCKFVTLTKNQQEYLVNPSKFSTSSKVQYQRNIENKLRAKATEEFGTNSSTIVSLLLEKDCIENILDSEKIQEAIVLSLDYISELQGFYDLSAETRVDINKAYQNKAHVCSNKSLILLCELLHKRLDKLTQALNGYDVDAKKEEVIRNKTKFILKNIPNIDLKESEDFPKFVKGIEQPTYAKFKSLHKEAFTKGVKLQTKFYNYLYFCKWLKENQVDNTQKYFFYFLEDGELLLLPQTLNFVTSQSGVTYDKAGNKYKARVRVGGKTYSGRLVNEESVATEELYKIKNEVLQNIVLPVNIHLITDKAYDFLKSFKFEIR